MNIRPIPDAVLNAAARLRAVKHNRPHGVTPEQHREEDDRVFAAEVSLESELLKSGMMSSSDAIAEIHVDESPKRTLITTMFGESITLNI